MGKRLMIWAGLCAGLLAVAAMTSLPAAAEEQKKGVTTKKQVVSNKPRRIVVQPRSYLDGGTEVLPGDRKFTDYAIPPNYSATAPIDNTAFSRRPYPTFGGIWPGNW